MKALYVAEVTTQGNRDGGHTRSSDGSLDLIQKLPKELGGQGGGTNPEQLFAAGYSACFGSAIAAVSKKLNVELKGSEVKATVGIGKKENGEGFALEVELDVKLPGLSQENAQKVLEAAHQLCPYSNAIRNNVPVKLSVST